MTDSTLIARAATTEDYATEEAFTNLIRRIERENIGEDADEMTVQDFVSNLSEDGWPDARLWLEIWCRDPFHLTPAERRLAILYYIAGEDFPEERLPRRYTIDDERHTFRPYQPYHTDPYEATISDAEITATDARSPHGAFIFRLESPEPQPPSDDYLLSVMINILRTR